jgi:hypothetical protein
MALLPKELAKAGTALDIAAFDFSNRVWHFTAKGSLTAAPDAAFDATGKIGMDMTGRDALLAALEKRRADPAITKPEKIELKQAVNALQTLQRADRPPGGDGNAAHHYDFELTKSGQATLNGIDIDALAPAPADKAEKNAPPEKDIP